METKNRRGFIRDLSLLSAAAGLSTFLPIDLLAAEKKEFFKISLAQWSLHKTLFAGKLKNIDFPTKAKKEFGIDIVEYVSPFFNKQESDKNYLKALLDRTQSEGVKNHLIMIDGQGSLGDSDGKARTAAVENHYKWVEAAKFLGCKSIRVNAAGKGTEGEVKTAVIDGLGRLSAFGKDHKINIIVENHGGYSSDGKWLSSVISQVNNPYCGTLPDLGNFRISAEREYDKYLGVQELLPFAKGVSAKTNNFNAEGEDTGIDYQRMFKIIKEAKWSGIVGIEYEGSAISEDEGIRKTKALLDKMLQQYG